MTLTASPQGSALRRFVAAVHDFSDDPGPENLERYLEASRELEEAQAQGSSEPESVNR
jgi:hypothetical protein